jgi:hypothetical protein
MLHNFQIQAGKEISNRFIQNGIVDFSSAIVYIQDLPYKRNSDKNPSIVLDEQFGTCSTKHALLKILADENGQSDVKLMMGIYKMNASNTKSVKEVLEKYKLEYIPEAHNYLKMGSKIIDATKRSFVNTLFVHDLLVEEEITPSQIGNYKSNKHKEYLKDWLQENPHIAYHPQELWAIREECIAAISNK